MPTQAFLRIETGRHTATVNRLAVANGGARLVSVSDDKTARIWDTATGDLLSILRVPTGDGLEGALYSVAMSPDGSRMLVSGYTGVTWDGRPSVYLFDVPNERLMGRLGPLPAVVNHMAFSPDGKRFALSMGKSGVTIHQADGKLLTQDRDFQDMANWVAFAPNGYAAATSADGVVRLYDPDGRVVAKQKFAGGAGGRPFSVEFAPSGELLAVGFVDRPRVEILSVPDLQPRFTPNTADIKQGQFNTVSFVPSATTTYLVASGTARGADGRIIMRRWSDNGLGRPVDELVAQDSVNQVVPLGDGKIAIATAEPAVDIGPLIGERRNLTGNTLDLRNVLRGKLLTDRQGSRVMLAADANQPTLLFDLSTRQVGQVGPAAMSAEWIGPQSSAGGIVVTDWRQSRATKIAGKPLTLEADERSLSVSVMATTGMVVLGTDFRLRLFDRSGAERHALDAPAAVWGVVASGDGQRVVATLGDGTVRVYDIIDYRLVERTGFFLHRDLKRWVAWTPEGFFDHSDEGGKQLVGYVLNRKRAEGPEFISFAQLYRLFYAPDLVKDRLFRKDYIENAIMARVSAIGDVRQRFDAATPPLPVLEQVCFQRLGMPSCIAVEGNNRLTSRGLKVVAADPSATVSAIPGPAPAPAPQTVVDIELPQGIQQIQLKYALTDRGGGVGPVDFFLNERNAGRERLRGAGAAASRDRQASKIEREVSLSPGVNRIQVRAYDQGNGVYAESRPIFIKAQIPTDAEKPSLYVLSAGINAYRGDISKLELAKNDAVGFAAAVKDGSKGLFKKVQVKELYDEAVTPESINAALHEIELAAEERDTVLVYLSGHGEAFELPEIKGAPGQKKGGEVQKEFYYITQNVDLLSDGSPPGPSGKTRELPPPTDDSELADRVRPQSFSGSTLVTALGNIKARNGFIFLDTCHSGAVNLDTGQSNIAHETGRYVLTAAASVEAALDQYDTNHGVFASAVLRALRGVPGTTIGADGTVDNVSLGYYVRDAVEILAKEVAPQHRQSARFKISAQDSTRFPLVKATTKR